MRRRGGGARRPTAASPKPWRSSSIERSIKAHKEGAGLRATPSAPGDEYSGAPHREPPPQQAAAAPRSLNDQAQVQQLQRESAGVIHRLHEAVKKTLKRMGRDTAPAELLSPVVLNDVLMRTDAQWAVLESAAAFLAALELAALVARINLVTEDGELDVH